LKGGPVHDLISVVKVAETPCVSGLLLRKSTELFHDVKTIRNNRAVRRRAGGLSAQTRYFRGEFAIFGDRKIRESLFWIEKSNAQ
jgi:hypothetical protein